MIDGGDEQEAAGKALHQGTGQSQTTSDDADGTSKDPKVVIDKKKKNSPVADGDTTIDDAAAIGFSRQ